MIDDYRSLLARHQWLENGLCWIVVQPLSEEINLDDLLWRLNNGRDPEQRTLANPIEPDADSDGPVIFVFEGEGAWGFLNFDHGITTPDPFLAELSKGSRLWMTTWHFKGGDTLLYAAGGQIRARHIDYVFGGRPVENGDPSVLADFRAMLTTLDQEDFRGKRSAAFAFIEAASTVGIESECLEAEEASVVVLDNFTA
ncbi:hypothetical protein C1I98_36180 [Spongiactinospora gelatinilytica]|uniref:Uncharacterized protein n=1 Tax=Spongiactinospora gelatinilytica TaxID=2666298 RepID=A0A2W2ELQ4_9ACTN|nr:hypothetical protein [Spongiactinospora gelatinilytica]PZG23641.1 hypothetical protein C1I98_36180 [Spongiactinospora gelatinilytica]